MRLPQGGDRKARRALHMIAVVRLRCGARTLGYMQRRLTAGLSKKDRAELPERLIARETFNDLKNGRIVV